MEQAKQIWNASLLGRCLEALCRWFSGQWERSRVIRWFTHPAPWGAAVSESSLFFRLWQKLRRALASLCRFLRLDRLLEGSVFLRSFLWCALAAALAPVLPTMALLGLVLLGTASLLMNLFLHPERPLSYAPINRWVLLYAAVFLAGTAFSVSPSSSWQAGLLTAAFVAFAVILGNAVENRRQLDFLLFLLVLAGTAVSLYGVLQYIFRWGYQSSAWVDDDMFSSITFRVTSTLANPNMLGQYLLLLIPLGGAKLLGARTWGKRLFYFCCCAVMCLCMILTFSRGAWLGLLFAGLVFLLLLNPRFIFLAPIALAALYFVLPETVIGRFTSIGDLTDHSTSYRVYIWMGTLDMLKDGYWLCGIGPGPDAFNLVYPAYSYSDVAAPHAHNLFLQLLCDAGISALAVFLVLLVKYFRCLCGALGDKSDWTSRVLQIGFTAGVCGFLVQAMTDYSFYNYRVMFLFWVYLALGCLCAKRGKLPGEGAVL